MNLKFGTGGLRATMGPGSDHLNLETVQEATLGVAAYAKEESENPARRSPMTAVIIQKNLQERRRAFWL